jgi:glycosyltransferase involved in cell wall biosynthesis
VGVGLGADGGALPTVASFGFVSPAKCSEVVLAAMSDLPGVQLGLVGHSGDEYLSDLRLEAARLGMADRVDVTGKVDEATYSAWMARTTVAVQLRLASNGESSASVAETLAAGIPTVVTDLGTFSEYPDDVVVKVPAGIGGSALARVLAELLADEPRRRALSEAGRRYAARHSFAVASRQLVEALVGGVTPVGQVGNGAGSW